MQHKHSHYSEKITVFLSVLCAIHCILTPILVVLMPLAAFYLEQYHWIEYILIGSVFVLGTSSILHGYKEHHQNKMPAYIFFFGLILLVAANLVGHLTDFNNSTLHFISGIGGIAAGVGQLYNLKLNNSKRN